MPNRSTSLKVLLLSLSILAPHCAVVAAGGNLRTADESKADRWQVGHSQAALVLEEDDVIYADTGFPIFSPVVVEEYKTIFFTVAKAASTEWIRMLTRMTGNPSWCATWIHKAEVNKLKRLYDYSIADAQKMMTSPEWTRAIFVRRPLERVLSAFLDKAVVHTDQFADDYCKSYERRGGHLDDCIEYHEDFGFFLKNFTTVYPDNTHWFPIYPRIDEKWWPQINFIGNFESLSDDVEKYLRSINSEDGVTAWERYGKTGWSNDERNCKAIGDKPFLGSSQKDVHHLTNANSKLLKYYTPELEKVVKTKYEMDLNNPYFQFSPLELFDPEAVAEYYEGYDNEDEDYDNDENNDDDDIDYDDDYESSDEEADDDIYYDDDEEGDGE